MKDNGLNLTLRWSPSNASGRRRTFVTPLTVEQCVANARSIVTRSAWRHRVRSSPISRGQVNDDSIVFYLWAGGSLRQIGAYGFTLSGVFCPTDEGTHNSTSITYHRLHILGTLFPYAFIPATIIGGYLLRPEVRDDGARSLMIRTAIAVAVTLLALGTGIMLYLRAVKTLIDEDRVGTVMKQTFEAQEIPKQE